MVCEQWCRGLKDGGGIHPNPMGDDVARLGGDAQAACVRAPLDEVGGPLVVNVVEEEAILQAELAACDRLPGLRRVYICGAVGVRAAPIRPRCKTL